MTRLKLCSGYLVDQDTNAHGLSVLQTLELEHIGVHVQWMEKFSSLLSGLIFLELHDCMAMDAVPVPTIASLRLVLRF